MFYKFWATVALIFAVIGTMGIASGESNFFVWIFTFILWIAALILFLWSNGDS
jgi:hypothetical protein